MQGIIDGLVSGGHGYPVIFLLLLGAGLGVPIPEDVPLLAAGVLATHPHPGSQATCNCLSVWTGAAACGVFVLTRDFIVYGLGRRYGTAILRRRFLRRIASEVTVNRYQALIRRRAIPVVFIGRFVVGLRSAIFFAAGTAGVRARVFLIVDGIGALISVPCVVWLGWRFASDLHKLEKITKDIRLVTLCLFGLLLLVLTLRHLKRRLDKAADQATEAQQEMEVSNPVLTDGVEGR